MGDRFNWLHLSDLHWGDPRWNNCNWPEIRDELCKDIKNIPQEWGPLNAVFFTGDLVFKGYQDEYKNMQKDLLEPLFKKLGELGHSPVLLAVPGNHDLQCIDKIKWPKDGKFLPQAEELAKPGVFKKTDKVEIYKIGEAGKRTKIEDNIRNLLLNEETSPYRKVINEAFKEYLKWWNKQPFRLGRDNSIFIQDKGILPGDFSATFKTKGGKRIGVLGLNTAFLQLKKDEGKKYKGHLAWDRRQFQAVCCGKNDEVDWWIRHHACILMTHHGPAWIDKNLYPEVRRSNRFTVHLFGHTHEEKWLNIVEDGKENGHSCQCPAIISLETYNGGQGDKIKRTHGYVAGSIMFEDNQNASLCHWPRIMKKSKSCGWEPEPGYPTPDGCRALPIRLDSTLDPEPSKEECQAALKCYHEHLVSVCSEVPLEKLIKKKKNGKPITLDQIFIDLKHYRKGLVEEVCSEEEHSEDRNEIEKAKTIMSAANDNDTLAIFGEPRSGKSAFVNYLILKLARTCLNEEDGSIHKEWEHEGLSPIRISMSGFALDAQCPDKDESPSAMWSHIHKELTSINVEYCEDIIRQDLDDEDKDCLVVFDDLDTYKTNDQWGNVGQAIDCFMRWYPSNRFILTCTKDSFTKLDIQDRFEKDVTIGELKWNQIKNFITKWYHALVPVVHMSKKDLVKEKNELIKCLNKDVKHYTARGQIARNPHLLTALTVIYTREPRELPIKQSELYECIAIIFAKQICDSSVIDKELEKWQKNAYDLLNNNTSENKPVSGFPDPKLIDFLAGRHMADKIVGFDRKLYELLKIKDCKLAACLAVEYLLSKRTRNCAQDQYHKKTYKALDAMYNLCPSSNPKTEEAWRGILWAGLMLKNARDAKNLGETIEDKYKPDGGETFLKRIREHIGSLKEEGKCKLLEPCEIVEAGTVLNHIENLLAEESFGNEKLNIEWREVPAGPFLMGSNKDKDAESLADEWPLHVRSIDQSYLISKCLVTNAQYKQFSSHGYSNEKYWQEAKNADEQWTNGKITKRFWDDQEEQYVERGENEPHFYNERHGLNNHPVVGVSWFEAVAYCRWLTELLKDTKLLYPTKYDSKLRSAIEAGKIEIRLPAEAEWEKAARWDHAEWKKTANWEREDWEKAAGRETAEEKLDRTYPWGYEFNENKCNFGETKVPNAVGIFPEGASPCGCMDMAGNVWEWCQSKYTDSYENEYKKNSEQGISNIKTDRRVLRGGSFGRPKVNMRCACRHKEHPGWAGRRTGFRVVLAAKSKKM